MSTGEGKGWARGKTAAMDPRIRTRTGMRYKRHIPRELDRRCARRGFSRVSGLQLAWNDSLAYVVGLTATDGCLSAGKTITFTSADRDLVEVFLDCLGRSTKIGTTRGTLGDGIAYRTQVGDVALYDWLKTIGLTERKSLTIGALTVPEEFLMPVARGLLDGDGSLLHYWYDGTGKAAGKRYEGFCTRFISASRPHLIWLQERLGDAVGIKGFIVKPPPEGGCWALGYAIRESCILLPRLYPSADVPKLERKWWIWKQYADRHSHSATLADVPVEEASVGTHSARANRDSKGRFRTLSRAVDG